MLTVVVGGIADGALAGVLFGRLVESQLFGVRAADPGIFVISTTSLLTASLLAALSPAWRASRISPIAARCHE